MNIPAKITNATISNPPKPMPKKVNDATKSSASPLHNAIMSPKIPAAIQYLIIDHMLKSSFMR